MAARTDYDSERDAELALAELTGARIPEEGQGGRSGTKIPNLLTPRTPELRAEELSYSWSHCEEPRSDAELMST